ncbi:hypothetical protein E4U42_002174 [Claviceps africana]|uniref:Amidase domain-containing protein n=1 Tax=Claviceps africana TaxID=83212 RepID=A0A8K0J911_9HYPO|nr:hypothetical protein E4U42_002174 [Claviceps africana]
MEYQSRPSQRRNVMDWSADETINSIRNRSITARDYISDVLHRAYQVQPLNAFLRLMPEEALSEADKIDQIITHGHNVPPLAGLAIVVKDNIDQAGVLTTAGTEALLNNRPKRTAPSLKKLLAAGAIVIGRTNMHELALGITSTNMNAWAQPVRNPYNTTMIPGGSSGGTAAAIASRVVTCGLGTDTGGSVRIPAALTGTAGFRPSVGKGGNDRRYLNRGYVVPISRTRDTIGAMGRTVRDIALIDSVMVGGKRVGPLNLRGLRFGIPPVLWAGMDKEVEEVVISVAEKLQKAGVVLVKDDIPHLLEMDRTIGNTIALHEPNWDMTSYLKVAKLQGVDLKKINEGIASPDVKKLFQIVLNDTFAPEYDHVMKVGRPALQKLFRDYFAATRVHVMLFPTTILPATPVDPVHGSGNVTINGGPPMDAFSAYTRNSGPGSNAGIPGLSIPVGLTPGGLPVGIEIDGALASDEVVLRIGLSIENLLGPMPPPRYPDA